MAGCDGMVHLRRARQDDARGIAEVHVKTWQHAYRGLVPDDVLSGLSVDTREQFWRRVLAIMEHDRRIWLADTEGTVVGFVSAGPSEGGDAQASTGQVYAIYVTPDCWDRGVGRNLLVHAEQDLRTHGYADATLWVLDTNDRARAFYERAGWRADGGAKIEEFGGAQLSEVRYRKRLS